MKYVTYKSVLKITKIAIILFCILQNLKEEEDDKGLKKEVIGPKQMSKYNRFKQW